MDNKQEIEQLVEELNHHADLYYNKNQPVMSDQEYDHLFDKLVELENETGYRLPTSPTQRVGFEVKSKLDKVQHATALLSLDKTKSIDDLKKFIGNQDCILSLKLDGLTTKLTYNNGKLIQASTRGSGLQGEDITHSIKTVKSVPKYVPFKGRIEIVGESFIKYDDFEKINALLPVEDKYKNPRNLTAGSVRQLDSSISAKRNVNTMIFSVIEIEGVTFEKKSDQLMWLHKQGFYVNQPIHVNKESLESSIEYLKEVAQDKKIPIDGLVLTYDNLFHSKSLGVTGHHPKDSLAYKFFDEIVETEYTGTSFATTRTGMVSITGLFKTVNVYDTDISRASLHNVDIFLKHKLSVGSRIGVTKANMIIPAIIENYTPCDDESKLEKLPIECPACGGEVEIRKAKEARFLYCMNDSCEAKLLGKLVHFVSRNAMNIDGLSEASLAKFADLGYVKSFTDVMVLERHKKEIAQLEGFGLRSVNKMLAAIENSKTVPFEKFIYALGIPNVGNGTAKRLAKYFTHIYHLLETSVIELLMIEDIGEVVANSIVQYINDEQNKDEILRLISKDGGQVKIQYTTKAIEPTNSQLSGKTIVVTGTFTKIKRKEIEARIEELGAKLSSSVSKNTDILIAGEKAGSKLAKANELSVKIITDEDEIIQLLQ